VIRHDLHRPWLIARLPAPMRILSHAPYGPGFVMGDCVAWREVRDSDLSPGFAVEAWFQAEMARAPAPAQVGMMTSRDVGSRVLAEAEAEGIRARALVTLGLSNAESVGRRLPPRGEGGYGTVNILVVTSAALSEAAQIEALTIAVEARTAAILALGIELATGPATGSGTDCLALACPPGDALYAGLHTPVGEAVGAAVRQAVAQAGADWLASQRSKARARGAARGALPPTA